MYLCKAMVNLVLRRFIKNAQNEQVQVLEGSQVQAPPSYKLQSERLIATDQKQKVASPPHTWMQDGGQDHN